MLRALFAHGFVKTARLSDRNHALRTVDGSHSCTALEAYFEDPCRQKLVQQHSGDWTMTGKVPVARVQGGQPSVPYQP